MNVKLLLWFILYVQCFQHIQGLQDTCNANYSTSIVKPCVAEHKHCCRSTGKCLMRYNMVGTWSTALDQYKSGPGCSMACDRHFLKCRDKCDCAVQTNEVGSGRICKCVRTSSEQELKVSCTAACQASRKSCVLYCIRQRQLCPLKALTQVAWKFDNIGKCDAVCLRTIPSAGKVPICPIHDAPAGPEES